MSWSALHHLGNLTLTLPLAGAIAAWLLAAGERRAAACWLFLFAGALLSVGITKVAFLGWGVGLPTLGFKALSGHAAGVAAIYPVLFHQLLRRFTLAPPAVGAGLGFLLGAAVAAALILNDEHTVMEACAGWLVGAVASAGTLRVTHGSAAPPPLPGLACGLLAFGAASWAMQQAQVGAWMVKLALTLSGNSQPFHWGSCG